MKRIANLPRGARALAANVSKADLLEVAWHLASLCNEAGSADDDLSTFDRLVAELATLGRAPRTGVIDRCRTHLIVDAREEGGSDAAE